MSIQKYLSTCCLSILAIAIGCGMPTLEPISIATHSTVTITQTATEQDSSPPGSSRGEERRAPAPQTL